MSKNQNEYGPLLGTKQAEDFALKIFKKSREEKEAGRKGLPLCAWGPAGIGKTELPNMMVEKYKEMFGGNIVYLPMAQIEEKAELQGLPELYESTRILLESEDESNVEGMIKTVITNEGGEKKVVVDARTIYATPSWIPQVKTHGENGIFVIDDMNRTDGRIINSIMQLLQDGKLLGWTLPPGWEIWCTCNPDDGKHSVTSLDSAQMSRMVNFRQNFDAKSWLENWAIPTGLHSVAQNFVLAHREDVVQGERTNPRSWDKFFRLAYDDLELIASKKVSSEDNSVVVNNLHTYGLMNVDTTPLQTFIAFITNGFGTIPSVEEILDMKYNLDDLYEKLQTKGQLRVDIIASLDSRLVLHLKTISNGGGDMKPLMEGIRRWLKHKKLPAALRYKSVEDAMKIDSAITDPELADIIFSNY